MSNGLDFESLASAQSSRPPWGRRKSEAWDAHVLARDRCLAGLQGRQLLSVQLCGTACGAMFDAS